MTILTQDIIIHTRLPSSGNDSIKTRIANYIGEVTLDHKIIYSVRKRGLKDF